MSLSALPMTVRTAALLGLLVLAQPASAATQAGEVTLLTGMGTAVGPDGTVRNLSKGAPVYAGEIVNTATNSYANLKFTDGGLVLLRPNTRFQIEDYAYGTAAAPAPAAKPSLAPAPAPTAGPASAVEITGVSPDPLQAQAGKQTFTITGKGFKPGAVLILTDVSRNRTFPPRVPTSVSATKIERPTNFGPVAGVWEVLVRNADGTESEPYEFGVGTKVAHAAKPAAAPAPAPAPVAPPAALPPVATAAPPNSRAFFRLLKGGFRTVSGLIGKADVNAYKVSTPVATIGIRGTDYIVVLCDTACANDPVVAGSTGGAAGGAIIGVIQGGVFLSDKLGKQADVHQDQYVVTLPDGSTVTLPFEPKFLRIDPIPNPQSCQ
jgi:hypothetical protein